MQLESRIEFQKRLEVEGRWRAAKIWMDNWRRDKSSTPGVSAREIRELVWDEAEKVFPPLPVADQMAETWIDKEHLKKGHPDPLRDLLWVYEVFAVQDISANDAPNTGAWAMLCWARKNRDKFFDHLMSKGCTNTAQKKVKEVAEKRNGSSAKKTEPEDPGLKRLNRIFQRSGSSRKKKRPHGSEPNGGNGGGATGTRVPVVREGSSRPGEEPEVAKEDQ
jgi:hypothetical protein